MSVDKLKEQVGLPTEKKLKKQSNVIDLLEKSSKQIKLALPSHVTPNRMKRIILTEIRKNPKLEECEPLSFMFAVMQCCQLGLEPGSALGHAFIVPYNNTKKNIVEAQFQLGYKGMIDLARRSDQIISISAREVCKNDFFDYQYGLEENIVHRPAASNRGELIFVYAVARLKGGGVQFDVMSIDEVEKIRDAAPNSRLPSSPWTKYRTEMAKKTVIRRIFKMLPISIEIQTAFSNDERSDYGIEQELKDDWYVDNDTGELILDRNGDENG